MQIWHFVYLLTNPHLFIEAMNVTTNYLHQPLLLTF